MMKMLFFFVIFIFSLILQGCVAAAIVGTAAIGTKVATDPRTVGTQIDDNTLAIRINNALSQDKKLKKISHINVTVYQGKILLVGQLSNFNLLPHIKAIIMNIQRKNEILNEIRQGNPVNLGITLKDMWITTEIRVRLLINNQVKSSNIKVVTENGEVFLLGLINKNEGKIAANIASYVNGVTHVTTAFTYI